MNVKFTPQSLRDMRAIGDYIAADNPKRALTFVADLRVTCEALATTSDRYPLFGSRGYRRMPFGNYLIFYHRVQTTIRIVRVIHSARDLRDSDFD